MQIERKHGRKTPIGDHDEGSTTPHLPKRQTLVRQLINASPQENTHNGRASKRNKKARSALRSVKGVGNGLLKP